MTSFDALYGRTSGVASIQGPYLVFTSHTDGRQIKISLKNIQVSIEGINSHHYYFFDKANPQERICIQDKNILMALSRAGVAQIEKTQQEANSRRWRRLALVASPFVVAIALLIATPVFISFLPASLLGYLISPQQEKRIGEWLLPMVRLQFHVQEGHPAQAKMRILLDHLKAANPELQELYVEIYISQDPVPNAFAVPGNKIVINRGIFKSAESIDEIVGVLAHELGHVEQRHVLKSLSGTLGKIVGTLMLAALIGPDQSVAIMKTANFLHLKYSRDDETAADKRGFEFLHQAHVSTAGMIHFFEKLAKQDPSFSSLMVFASTHPASEDRVHFLSQMAKELPDLSPVALPVELQELKALF